MRTQRLTIALFLKNLMQRSHLLRSQLARDLQVSHVTVIRWLSGEDIPSISSCRKLSEYSGVSLSRMLSIAGHLPARIESSAAQWPEFREYARKKYPKELDDDLIAMIEDLIERRRKRDGRRTS